MRKLCEKSENEHIYRLLHYFLHDLLCFFCYCGASIARLCSSIDATAAAIGIVIEFDLESDFLI